MRSGTTVHFLVTASIAGTLLAGAAVLFPASHTIDDSVLLSRTISGGDATSGDPVRIVIPDISVDAVVYNLGVTKKGIMEAPTDSSSTGWFKLGPRPGAIGSAVIAGHFGPWKNGSGSVFDDLSNLKKGDMVFVTDTEGAITTFVVREIRDYPQNTEVPEVFASNDQKAHLNIITCEGIWGELEQTYSNRLVVFTDKK